MSYNEGIWLGSPWSVNLITPKAIPKVVDKPATLEVGTPEWDALTERRAALIAKKYGGSGLTPEEETEYTLLQEKSRAAINNQFPRPKMSEDELAAVEAAIKSGSSQK